MISLATNNKDTIIVFGSNIAQVFDIKTLEHIKEIKIKGSLSNKLKRALM